MQQLADTRTAVHARHRYAASPARVFDAWLTPQMTGQWLFATALRPAMDVRIEARNGGAFCFVEHRAGTVIEHRGHYDEIMRPRRLVFSLQSPDYATHATFVTVEFMQYGTGCELQLMHDGLPANHAARIEARWTGMLYGLGVMLRQSDIGKLI